MQYLIIAAIAMAASTSSQAATVFRCVDAKGKVTFTAQANCPDNHALNDVVTASNPTISAEGEETVMAKRRRHSSAPAY